MSYSAPPPFELERPRDFADILKTALSLYTANFRMLLAIAAAVVIPVDLIVEGVGLEQLWSEYDETPPIAELIVPSLVSALVTTPLVSAMVVLAMIEQRDGREVKAGATIQRGLELFTPIFLALLLALGGVTLGLALLIVPGIYLAIRWYFVTPSVVVDGLRGTAALRRSAALVQDNWWRVFGILLGTGLVSAIPAFFIGIPFGAIAAVTDQTAPVFAGNTITEVIVAPFGALVLTLLYFDLRSRKRAEAIPHAVSGPPDPPGLPPQQ